MRRAVDAAREAHREWANLAWEDRAAVFLRAGDPGRPAVTAHLQIIATLAALTGQSTEPGEVNGQPITAAHLRELLAQLGFRSLDEAVGHADVLDATEAVDHWKAAGLDIAPVFHVPELHEDSARRRVRAQDHGLDKALDNELIALSEPALERERRPHGRLPRLRLRVQQPHRPAQLARGRRQQLGRVQHAPPHGDHALVGEVTVEVHVRPQPASKGALR